MKEFDKVKLNLSTNRILSQPMKEWMIEHKDRSFRVERVVDGTVKLFKVDFWISEDLLIVEN